MPFGSDRLVVPGLEVVDSDGSDGRVLGLTRIRAGGTVDEPDRFANGDTARVVVAAGDAGIDLSLGQRELVGLEGG